MASQDVAFELYYDGAWRDLVVDDDVLSRSPIRITRGQGDESPAPRPAQITAELANDDDRYRTSNPESPLYGKAGRNTPARVSVAGSVRGAVEASSWVGTQSRDFRRTPRRGSASTEFAGGGLLQRVNQWTEPLRSAMTRDRLASGSVVDLWPLEDVAGAAQGISPLAGRPTERTNVDFGDPDHPGGGSTSAKIGENANLFVRYANPSTTSWTTGFVFRLNTTPADTIGLPVFQVDTTSGYAWQLFVNDTGFNLNVGSPSTLDVDQTIGLDLVPADLWTYNAFGATESGGTVSWFWLMYSENAPVIYSFGGSFSGTLGRPIEGVVNDNDYVRDARYTQMFSTTDGDYSSASYFTYPFNGYPGETAGDRFVRLMAEEQLDGSLVGDADYSYPMGPQPAAPLSEQLAEMARTEDGLIFDAVDGLELVFLLRAARCNQTPAVELVPEDLPFLPDEVTDDLPVHNIVTASQRDGGDYTVRDDIGPLGTLPPPVGVGEYRQTLDVNVADPDADLPQVANWWLRRGTVDLPRFPQVTVNLATLSPAKLAQVEAVDIGNVITITGFRENVIRLHVLGYTETIGWPNARKIVFVCAPDQQFAVGAYDSTATRYDLRTCTVTTAAGPTATTLVLGITADESWSTTSAYDLMIAGELVGIPAGGMGARSGSLGAYAQTATGVARSKNGIRKTLPAGSPVHVATPGRYGL